MLDGSAANETKNILLQGDIKIQSISHSKYLITVKATSTRFIFLVFKILVEVS